MDETQRCGRCKEVLPVEAFAPSYRGKTGTWCRACFAAFHRGEYDITARHEPRRCEYCGVSYVPRQLKAGAAYCSRPCKDKARRARERAERLAAKPADRRCKLCGFTLPRNMRADALFCSTNCSDRAHQLPRALRSVENDRTGAMGRLRATIFERDRWQCGICLGAVDPSLHHPDLMSATLDHIVPLVEGGTHDSWNLRLTHLQCNVARGNRGEPEQLAML